MFVVLPSPSTLQADLQDLDSQLQVNLQTDISAHRASLEELKTDTIDAMDAPISTISTSESLTSDLSTKMSAYNDALIALPG